jgi:hypothetical protein
VTKMLREMTTPTGLPRAAEYTLGVTACTPSNHGEATRPWRIAEGERCDFSQCDRALGRDRKSFPSVGGTIQIRISQVPFSSQCFDLLVNQLKDFAFDSGGWVRHHRNSPREDFSQATTGAPACNAYSSGDLWKSWPKMSVRSARLTLPPIASRRQFCLTCAR